MILEMELEGCNLVMYTEEALRGEPNVWAQEMEDPLKIYTFLWG